MILFSASSCSHIEAYFRDRAYDAVDILTVKFGAGLGLHTGVDICGLFSTTIGMSHSYRVGLEGRHFVRDYQTVFGFPFYNLIVPVESVYRADYDRYNNSTLGTASVCVGILSTGDEKIYRIAIYDVPDFKLLWKSVCEFSTADKEAWLYNWGDFFGVCEGVPDPCSCGLRDYDFRVHACVLFAWEIGFSPVELADFLLGLITIDILDDDEYAKALNKPPVKK